MIATLGLRFRARAFSSCGKWRPLFIAVRGPLTIAASLVAEHRLQTRMLSNCGSRALLLRGMLYPPRPGLEPVSPALAGRFSTTAPPGKPQRRSFVEQFVMLFHGAISKLPLANKVRRERRQMADARSTQPVCLSLGGNRGQGMEHHWAPIHARHYARCIYNTILFKHHVSLHCGITPPTYNCRGLRILSNLDRRVSKCQSQRPNIDGSI